MFQSLKELRSQRGLNQSDLAKKINTSVPAISMYENGQAVPCIEQMLILEREFGQRIAWEDSIDANEKAEIIRSLTTLAECYPLTAVLTFAQKNLREGIRVKNPGMLINFYAEVARKLNIEPLAPTEIKFK